MPNTKDTNQASEDELIYGVDLGIPGGDFTALSIKKGSTLFTFTGDEAVAIIELIRTEKLKLLDELGKSMPTAEQLTTKYGYYMPEKQYGYKLALHDIREVLAKLEAEL